MGRFPVKKVPSFINRPLFRQVGFDLYHLMRVAVSGRNVHVSSQKRCGLSVVAVCNVCNSRMPYLVRRPMRYCNAFLVSLPDGVLYRVIIA